MAQTPCVVSLRPTGDHATMRRAAAAHGWRVLALSPWRIVVRVDDDTRRRLRAALAADFVIATSPAAVRAAATLSPLRARRGQQSVSYTHLFHIFGGYNRQETDDFNIDVDQWKLGVGYNYGINDKVDLVTRVAYQKLDVENAIDFDGYSAEVGVRGAMGEKFEGYAFAGYEDYEEFDGDFYGRLGATVKFNQNWGLNGDVKFADGDTEWFVGPRFTW